MHFLFIFSLSILWNELPDAMRSKVTALPRRLFTSSRGAALAAGGAAQGLLTADSHCIVIGQCLTRRAADDRDARQQMSLKDRPG